MCFLLLYLHWVDVTGYSCTESREETLYVNHKQFLASHQDLTLLLIYSTDYLSGSLFGGATSGLSCIHLGVLLPVFFKGIE